MNPFEADRVLILNTHIAEVVRSLDEVTEPVYVNGSGLMCKYCTGEIPGEVPQEWQFPHDSDCVWTKLETLRRAIG